MHCRDLPSCGLSFFALILGSSVTKKLNILMRSDLTHSFLHGLCLCLEKLSYHEVKVVSFILISLLFFFFFEFHFVIRNLELKVSFIYGIFCFSDYFFISRISNEYSFFMHLPLFYFWLFVT